MQVEKIFQVGEENWCLKKNATRENNASPTAAGRKFSFQPTESECAGWLCWMQSGR